MEEVKIDGAPIMEEKMSYEELEEKLRLAVNEILRLRKIVGDLSDNRGVQRLEFLFKVVDNPMSFDDGTTTRAIKEIKEALFPLEETEIKEAKKNNE